MSVFDPLHHDHINTPVNTPLINPLELQMVGGGCRMKTGGVITPPGGVWINHCTLGLHPVIHVPNYMDYYSFTDPRGMDD